MQCCTYLGNLATHLQTQNQPNFAAAHWGANLFSSCQRSRKLGISSTDGALLDYAGIRRTCSKKPANNKAMQYRMGTVCWQTAGIINRILNIFDCRLFKLEFARKVWRLKYAETLYIITSSDMLLSALPASPGLGVALPACGVHLKSKRHNQ